MTHQPIEPQRAAIRQCIGAYRNGKRPLAEVMADLESLVDQLPDTSWRTDVIKSWTSVVNAYDAARERLSGTAEHAGVRQALDEVLKTLEDLDSVVADRPS
jgi:PAS domain-containing protein